MKWTVKLLVLIVACLWGGCECVSDEEELASIEEPIEARIVYVKKTGVKLEGGPHFVVLPTGLKTTHDVVLRVEDHDQRSLFEHDWSPSTEVELASDPKGERLAYREKEKRWKIVYLLSKEHVFVTSALHESLDWDKVDPFRAAAAHLFAQHVNRQDCVFEEVEKAGGNDEVARVLGETVAVPSAKVWDDVYAKLPKAHQKKVQAVLRTHLRHDADAVALKRALRHLPLRDPALGPALVKLVEKLDPKDEEGESLAIALRAAALFDAKRTAELACGMIAKLAPKPREQAFFALAHAKSACAAAEPLVIEALCGPLRCLIEPTREEEPCDDSLWGKPFAEIAAVDPGAVASSPSPDSWQMMERAWAYRVKQPVVERTRARFGYAVDQPETPACHAASRKGEPCRCDEAELRNGLCALGNDTTGASESCTFVVDDAASRVTKMTAVAVSELSTVSRGHGHGCGIAVDGTVRCWGVAPFGLRPSGAPAPVRGWDRATLVASAKSASCAVAGGKLSCLGVEVGPGTSTYELERAKKQPDVVPVAFDGKIKQLAMTGEQGCLLDDGGRVHCWSLTRAAVSAPLPVPEIEKVMRIDGGDVSVVALREDGTAFEVSCVGSACKHEKLGAGDLTLALRVVAEGVGITKNGNAVQWLRAGPKAGVLEPVAGLSQVTALAQGGYRTCALLATHEVRCFTRGAPVSETMLEKAIALSGGGDRITALLEDGSFVTWNPSKEKPSRNYQ